MSFKDRGRGKGAARQTPHGPAPDDRGDVVRGRGGRGPRGRRLPDRGVRFPWSRVRAAGRAARRRRGGHLTSYERRSPVKAWTWATMAGSVGRRSMLLAPKNPA